MITLIIGGSGSGKSEYAENLAASRSGQRTYIATMIPWDEEGKRRIAKHRAMRAGKGFETVEHYGSLSELSGYFPGTVLLECLSNLTANAFYSPEYEGRRKELPDVLTKEVLDLSLRCGELIVVSNNIFDDGGIYGQETMEYLEILAEVNRRLAAEADEVTEVILGIPVAVKTRPVREEGEL